MRDAEMIMNAAKEKGAEKMLADQEFCEAMNSIDKLTWDVEQAYKALVDKCGQHRAAEIVQELVMRS